MEKPTGLSIPSTLLTDLFGSKVFNAADKEIAMAVAQPSIRNFHGNEFHNKMIVLIAKIHANCGFKLDEFQLSLTIDELCEDLKKYDSTLSFAEIELAFKNGYKKQYGDFFGLNNATYFGWVNAYTYSENRLRVKKLLCEAKENANKEPQKKSQEEIDQLMKSGILKSFEDFKNGATIFDAGNVKYHYLVKVGLINYTKERKLEILEQTKIRLKAEAVEKRQQNQSVEQALSKISDETIISEAKKESLKIYFKGLMENGVEITELLEGV